MILNHVDLQVSNVNAARAFFEVHFGLRCTYQRGEQIAILEDEGGFCFGVSNLRNGPPPIYPPDFHVGFVLKDTQRVRETYSRLKEAGVGIKFDLQEAGPNLAFQCLGPDAIPVEVRAPLKSAPPRDATTTAP
jgi:catechol 2,3-dioxygenase-like lactoylglutathione lyase family enzyme